MMNRLDQPITEMMLADGLTQGQDENIELPDVDPKATLLRLSAIIESAATSAEKSIQLVDDPTREDANNSLLHFARSGDIQGAMHMYNVMNALSIPLEQKAIAPLIKAATRAKDFTTADQIFSATLNDDSKDVSLDMWAAKIHNLAHQRDPEAAEAILNDLIKVNLQPQPTMYSAVLGAYVNTKNFPKAYAFWERMHMENVEIDHDGFHHMFNYCLMNGQSERAFFYYDEMTQSYNLDPTLRTFKLFFEAVGTAPAFVPGYQDTLLDALAIMDGKEMIPDAGVYEAVIGGFAKARDPVAAEYYFWEMQRKGIAPTSHVYANLLLSFAQAQSVGANRYGTMGRYSKPPAKKPTPDQQDLIDLGPMKVAKIRKLCLCTVGVCMCVLNVARMLFGNSECEHVHGL
jgi:pentatricopeptide repeat protein